ncbi:MAG: iron-sulfur cluster assembly scaffold protein [Acidobacteriota bacterium]|nr:iron-sulfur cluster assembly scaffold protein [Acidobacteriota bacterium]
MLCISGRVAELFFNPTNVGDAAEPRFVGRSASFQCGASLRISLRVDASQRIADAKFKAAGCSVLVASASLLISQVLGKTTGEAAALSQQAESLTEQLGAKESGRSACAAISCEALVAAVAQYSASVRDDWQGDEALICTCFGVSERTIEREVQANRLSTIAEVTAACNAGAGCRSCYPLIEEILDDCQRSKMEW